MQIMLKYITYGVIALEIVKTGHMPEDVMGIKVNSQVVLVQGR